MQGAATQAMPGHRRGAATPQMAHRRRNPKGARGLWPSPSLLVVHDAPASTPPRALDMADKTLARVPQDFYRGLLGYAP